MNNAFLALTAAGFAGLVDTASTLRRLRSKLRKSWIPRQTIRGRLAFSRSG
jgi:hypothetical protein